MFSTFNALSRNQVLSSALLSNTSSKSPTFILPIPNPEQRHGPSSPIDIQHSPTSSVMTDSPLSLHTYASRQYTRNLSNSKPFRPFQPLHLFLVWILTQNMTRSSPPYSIQPASQHSQTMLRLRKETYPQPGQSLRSVDRGSLSFTARRVPSFVQVLHIRPPSPSPSPSAVLRTSMKISDVGISYLVRF